MKKTILFWIICLLCASVYGQNSSVGVNPLTGAASVAIPIYSFTRGQVTFPITLVYGGNGIKNKDVEGTAGMGWNLQAGGQISRQVRGIPDDCSSDQSGNDRFGWMSSSNTAHLFTGGIPENVNTCVLENKYLAYISTNFPITQDPEPDLFYVSAPGLSCELVYDPNASTPGFKPVTYQDLKISTADSAGRITSFTITNDKGIKYVFSMPERDTITTVLPRGLTTPPQFFSTKYLQYQHGIIYNDNWHLTSITDVNGNGISLTYSNGMSRRSSDPVILYLNGATSTSPTTEYIVQQGTRPKILDQVQSTDGDLLTNELTFVWASSSQIDGGTDQTYINTIKGMGKTLKFNYSSVRYVTDANNNYYRQFLRSYYDGTPNSPIGYAFSYYGETHTGAPGSNTYDTVLPDSSSERRDYWGYPTTYEHYEKIPRLHVNPGNISYQRYMIYQAETMGTNYTISLDGGVMTADTAKTNTGSLHTVTYAQGGATTINWESNDYYDPQASATYPGNGARVKAIKDDPFYSPASYRYYSYLNPSTSVSSGKPISLPQYAFTIPYDGPPVSDSAFWTAATAISENDLFPEEDHTIMYEYCRQTQPNAGVTQYQYYIPATNWDASATPACSGCTTADWKPTVDMVARHACGISTYPAIVNLTYSYPFIPNPNYDFERGLLKKVTNYLNDGTTEVSESVYQYQRSFPSPPPMSVVYGVRYDINQNQSGSLVVTGYSNYPVYYRNGELPYTVTNTVYDSQTHTQAQSTVSTYTFGSAYHKLLTQTDVANSDGSVLTTKTSYTKDFPSAGAGTNSTVDAIYNLNALNINAPVESYQQVTKSGVTKVTGGSLTLFKGFLTPSDLTFYLPSQQLRFVQPDGYSGTFTPFSASGTGSSQITAYNTGYFPVANFTAYDFSGILTTADDNNNHVVTTGTDHVTFRSPISVKNAAGNEIAFANFDSALAPAIPFISITPGTADTVVGHTGRGYPMATTQTATAQVHKNATAANYIFSIWINASAGTGTLNISLNGGTATPLAFTGIGIWKYYEWKIPVSTMPPNFTMAFTASRAISVDDILFYPENAEVTTYSYDPVTYARTSQTDTNGISVYYQSDRWGRLLYVRDQDHNIIQRKTYAIPPLNNE